jgi:DNA polymerase III sliding clamp (beta) subunit (PCNA family)
VVSHRQLLKLTEAVGAEVPASKRAGVPLRLSGPVRGAALLEARGHRLPIAAYEEAERAVRSPGEQVAELPLAELKRAVAFVRRSVGSDVRRLPETCGVRLTVGEGRVTLIGMDGFRAAVAPLSASGAAGTATREALVSLKALQRLLGCASADRVWIGWRAGDGGAEVTLGCGEVLLVSDSLTGEFRDLSRLFEAPVVATAVADRKELLAVAKRAVAVGKATLAKALVEVRVSPSGIDVVPLIGNGGSASALHVDATVGGLGEERRAHYQGAFLVAALESVDAERVALHLERERDWLRLTREADHPESAHAFRYVIAGAKVEQGQGAR